MSSALKGVSVKGSSIIYPNVKVGEGSVIEENCILGKPPKGKREGELPLTIGANAIIRPFTTIYAGNSIGSDFKTGQSVSLRENNVLGDRVSIGTNSVLEFGNRIGNGVHIHTGCFLEMVCIGNDVYVGPCVVFTDDPHPMNCPRYKECKGGVIVHDLARIGANCTLLPGVTVGRNCLIGAGSVVVHDVPENVVVVGNPAKLIKMVDELTCYKGYFEQPYSWLPYTKVK